MQVPAHGVRYQLERLEPGSSERCRYALTVATPEQSYGGEALLSADGAVELARLDPATPPELRAQLEIFARLLARAAPARAADGLPVWPERVQRWRPRPPSSSQSSSS